MKTKLCWESIIFVSPFYDEERKISEQKCSFAVKGSRAKSLFSIRRSFHDRFFQEKRPSVMRLIEKGSKNFCVGGMS